MKIKVWMGMTFASLVVIGGILLWGGSGHTTVAAADSTEPFAVHKVAAADSTEPFMVAPAILAPANAVAAADSTEPFYAPTVG